jgi:RNA polymerase sigma-54 factor
VGKRLRRTFRCLRREGHLGQPEATHYLRGELRSAIWLMHSLEQRRQTLDKVAKSLVTLPREFLDQGQAYLKSPVLPEMTDASRRSP